MVSTITSYQMIACNMTRSLQQTADKPDVRRDTEYYLAHIGDVKTIDDFLGDYRLFTYAMKAHGLSDMIYAKAFLRKVLTEGVAKGTSFANRLLDKRYRDFAMSFNFAALGAKATRTEAATADTAGKYLNQMLEEDAGDKNEGVRLALYFQRKAASIKGPYQLLADKALLKVAQTALGIPSLASGSDIDKQAQMLAKKINFDDFQDPKKLQRFLQRFTAMWEVDNVQPTSTSILINPIEKGISATTLASLQNLKLGR